MCKGSAFDRKKFYQNQKRDFVMKTTNATKYITTKNKIMGKDSSLTYLYAENFFPRKYLHLFQKIKKEVSLNIERYEIKIPDFEKKIIYNKFKDMSGELAVGEYIKYNDVLELDIVKAYYNAAFILGYISEPFYNECLKLPKFIRLALIGSIATNKLIYNYEKGQLKGDVETDFNKDLRRAWFHIVHYVDECLFDFYKLSGKNFLLYWVDAICLQKYPDMNEDTNIIETKYGLKFEPKQLAYVEIQREADCKFTFWLGEIVGKNKKYPEGVKRKIFQFTKKVQTK